MKYDVRNAFVRGLYEQMEVDKDTVLLTADLGWNSFDQIRRKYPDQFVNLGLAEQAMAGVSAGMSKMGKNVFIYSIIPFLLYRAFEQIRNDICYPDLAVRLVGTGAGFAYGAAGSTHHPFEDLRIVAALPNIVVLNPSDPNEVELFLKKTKEVKHPLYMRIGRNGEPIVHQKHNKIVIGEALKLTKGEDVLIISTGLVTKLALEVSEILNSRNEIAEVLEIHTFKPFDDETVKKEAEGKRLVVTIEDNNGALEERVAISLVNTNGKSKFLSFKVPNQFAHISAKSDYILGSYGINTPNITNQIKRALK